MKSCVGLLLVCCFFPPLLQAQHTVYAGALGGVATLAGDGRSIVTPSSAATSLFEPVNGGVASVFSGVQISNYVSLQGNYIWNRNGAMLVSSLSNPGVSSFYQQPVSITQNTFSADVLVYFRKRSSRIRPYLSEGGALVYVSTRVTRSPISQGSLPVPTATFASTVPASRTSVGIDVRLRSGWYFRYTFGETISHNPVSAQLSPPGKSLFKNFQNLFGVFRTF